MRKSSKFIMSLALLVVVALFAVCASQAYAADARPVRVAVIQSLTGSNASGASFQVQTLQLSADYFNMTNSIKSLGGVPIELVWIDNMSDINAMKTVVESAFQDNTYDFCILSGSTAYTMPAIAATTKAGVPSLTKAQGDAIFAQGCKNIFCIPVTSSVQARLPMEFFQYLNKTQDIDPTKFGILCIDNEHGIATQQTYEELLGSMEGFGYVYSQRYPADITDMSSVITAMKMSGVEILLTSNGDTDAKLLFNTMRAMNFNPISVASGSGVLYPSFYQDAGEAALGVMCASISNAFTTNGENSEDFKKLRQLCFERYGHFGGDFLAAYYSMIEVIAQTVEGTASRDWATNVDAMHKMEYVTTYQTVDAATGEYTDIQYFAENGTSPNSTALIVQFQKIDYEGKTLIEPVCIYPEANAIHDLVWDR